jgi:PEP-CTERM motif
MLYAMPAKADSINLLPPGSGSYAWTASFPAGSNYNSYYGTGLGYLETQTYGNGIDTALVVSGGSTVGSITKFANGGMSVYGGYQDLYGSLSNASFNLKTDTLTGTLTGQQYNLLTQSWKPVTVYLTETLALNGSSGTYDLGGGWTYSYQDGSVTSGNISTVPEPGTFGMLGTGLAGMAGLVRRKLAKR